MHKIFIEAKKKFENIDISKLYDIPNNVYLIYAIQYKNLADIIEKQLKSLGKKVSGKQQVLGCSRLTTKNPILYLGEGKFHPLNIAFFSNKEIMTFDSFNFSKITFQDLETMKKRQKAKISKFLLEKNIGILISTKSGQTKKKFELLKIKSYLEKTFPEKNFYYFISETFNIQELENFPLNIFINTACPGIELDSSKIINYENLKNLK